MNTEQQLSVIEKGNLVEYTRWGVIRIGFVKRVYPQKIMVINDEAGVIEFHFVKKEKIIGCYSELPPHIKTFR